MVTQGADWFVPLLRASEEIRRFMLTYRASGDMDERGITTHVAHLARTFQKSGAWPALTLEYDAKLKGQGGESVHGADYEVTLKGGGLQATFRLQAKRLFPAASSHGRYDSLAHHIGEQRARQVDRLIDSTGRYANAGYIFYNALEHSVADVQSGCCLHTPEVTYGLGGLGLTLAAAHEVRRRWGQENFENIFPVSVPVACFARCVRLRPRVDSRYPYFSEAIQPWELPFYAATAWADLAWRRWEDRQPTRVIQTVDQLPADTDLLLRRFSPFIEVARDGAPEYLQELSETGRVDLDDERRPADVLLLFDADGRETDYGRGEAQ